MPVDRCVIRLHRPLWNQSRRVGDAEGPRPGRDPDRYPGTADRTAATAASTMEGSRVSRPSASFGCTWRSTAPAATEARAAKARAAGVRGTPSVRDPLRHACSIPRPSQHHDDHDEYPGQIGRIMTPGS
jgi:hypothetical protein